MTRKYFVYIRVLITLPQMYEIINITTLHNIKHYNNQKEANAINFESDVYNLYKIYDNLTKSLHIKKNKTLDKVFCHFRVSTKFILV